MSWRVERWAELYEVAYSRKLKQLSWVALPVDLSSRGYLKLVRQPDGFALFGCWIAMIELAASMPERGLFVGRSGRAFDADDIADAIRAEQPLVIATIQATTAVGWLAESDTVLADGSSGVVESSRYRTGHNITLEKTPAESSALGRVPFDDLAAIYSEMLPDLPKLRRGVPKSQRKATAARWKESPSLDEWRETFKLVAASPFLMGENARGWRASFGWVIKSANWDKIINGQFQHSNKTNQTTGDVIANNIRRASDERRERESGGDWRSAAIAGGGIPAVIQQNE